MKKLLQLSFVFSLAVLVISCGSSSTTETVVEESEEQVAVVCLFDKLSVRQEPAKDAKYLSGLNLGEVATYLGESAIDSSDSNREYYKIELTDGTVGWSVSYGLAKDAMSAAIIENAVLFERPDLVTKTNKEYQPVEFVAIISTKDDWIEVVGKNKKKSGWIKENQVSKDEKDVAVATLAQKAGLIDGEKVKVEKIQQFLLDLPFDDSKLVTYLQEMMIEFEESKMDAGENLMVEDPSVDSIGI